MHKISDEIKAKLNKPNKLQCILQSKIEVAPETYALNITIDTSNEENADKTNKDGSPVTQFTQLPGQFYSLSIPPKDGLPQSRAYSAASSALTSPDTLTLYIKILEGEGSKYVDSLKDGDEVTLQGPFGLFIHDSHPKSTHDLLVCTGTGVAPFITYIEEATNETRPITLLFGVRTPEDLFHHQQLQQLSNTHEHITYIPCLSRTTQEDIKEEALAQSAHIGRVTSALKDHLTDTSHVYICGNPGMVEQVETELKESHNHNPEYISCEKY